MSTKNRVLFVVNKYWECDPVCWVLTNKYINEKCHVSIPWPSLIHYPTYGPENVGTPRMVFSLDSCNVEIWCISDLLARFPNESNYQSSSERKMQVMPDIFSYSSDPVQMVIAVGTASCGPFCPSFDNKAQDNINGSVIVGSNIFVHDGHPSSDPNPYSQWRWKYMDTLMPSSLDTSIFSNLRNSVPYRNLESLLLTPPTNPGPSGIHVYNDIEFIALSDVNVTNYEEYEVKDKATGDAFKQHCPENQCGVSLETTHGLIYAQAMESVSHGSPPPFAFISGIVDRYLHFSTDVNPKPYAQNVSGAHNAGVVVACLVESLSRG